MSDAETFSADDPYASRPKKSGRWVIAVVVGLVGGGALAAVLCCGALGYFGFGLASFGMGVVAEQVKTDLRGNPVIEEHLGTITSIEVDWTASAAAEGEDEFVFDVEGPKGKGRLRVVTVTIDQNTEDVVSGTLELSSGETYDLFPEAETESDAR
jgi:hypothetical protein